jgi:peptide-N4-(N-acetyl-beta-glucosaminyl)asparagine amidase
MPPITPPSTVNCRFGPDLSLTAVIHVYASMTVKDLGKVLCSLTEVPPSALHITTSSGAVLVPGSGQDELLLANAGIAPGDTVTVSDEPPVAAEVPQQAPEGPPTGNALAAALASISAARSSASVPEGPLASTLLTPKAPAIPLTVDALAASLGSIFPTSSGSFLDPTSTPEGAALVRKVTTYHENVLEYNDVSLQEKALAVIPMTEIRAAAYKSLVDGQFLCPDAALGKALLTWFKDTFFTWVSQPPCWSCAGKSESIGMAAPNISETQHRASRVELYECGKCHAQTRFPRYNAPAKLLETRRGRCGEFAQAFTLICIAAGLTSRIVYDVTDHLWTEIWSSRESRWMHADSCENILDEPQLYEAGWGKKLSYVFAVGAGSVQDVTRRYVVKYSDTLMRRTKAEERSLDADLTKLNGAAVLALSVNDRAFAIARNDADRKALISGQAQTPHDSDASSLPGRQSGSEEWVKRRGEDGKQ